jgi:hypothetical protein
MEITEDGELGPHDPALEWPGENVEPNVTPLLGASIRPQLSSIACTFRFVVLQTSILPKTQRIAIIDSYPELQFGRDVAPPGSQTPRLRLKEMEVSKLHATAYWDKSRSEWLLVDMGSKHGTFHATSGDGSTMTRLSPPRIASMPRRLHHLDHFTIGSTTFIVHMHQDGIPCYTCSLGDVAEIPLFPLTTSQTAALKRKRGEPEVGPLVNTERDPKKALNSLKRSLLSQHGATSAGVSNDVEAKTKWVDRSARRRALNSFSQTLQPRTSSPAPSPRQTYESSLSITSTPTPILAPPPPPILSSNVGHRLLE